MRFVKMHGLGNDYVYVNGFQERVTEPSRIAIAVSDRHFGVGSDGLILILPPEPGVNADVRMRMFNADGLEAEMCGNGIRCVCKFAHDLCLTRRNPMRVQTGRGVLTLAYDVGPDGKVARVTVDMGEPILEPSLVPVASPDGNPWVERPLDSVLDALVVDGGTDWIEGCGLVPSMTTLSMGPPHAVLWCRDVAAVPLEVVGPRIEHHALFPRRTNVNVVQVTGDETITMRTWERGSGITLACGTGACAAVVAGVLGKRHGRHVAVTVPGGLLDVTWREDDGHVMMIGPATEVFRGDWEPPKELA